MGVAEKIAEGLAQLPPDRQAEVLDFVEFLAARNRTQQADWTAGQFKALALASLVGDDDPVGYELSDCKEAL